jgi:hypothetical protein
MMPAIVAWRFHLRVLVYGGRAYADREQLEAELDKFHAECPITCLIEGGSTGTDQLAGEWARERGIATERYAAEWGHCRQTSQNRNQHVIDQSQPQVCIAFPGEFGTRQMTACVHAALIPLLEIEARVLTPLTEK